MRYSLVGIMILLSVITRAQSATDANVFGHVKSEGEHIPFATILVEETNLGTACDGSGHYMLVNLPDGDYVLKASALGYKSQRKSVSVVRGVSSELNFELSPDLIMVEGVVVSANRSQRDRRKSAVIVNTLSPKVFESTQAVCLAEGLSFTPGLRLENNCQNCGFTQLRMNGLDGPYSQILINSRPVFSGLAGVYGLEQIPANMIERVEVVRGGGSALFGGNAIAGTVNIITKEPIQNSFNVDLSKAWIGGSAPDNNVNFNGSVVSDDYRSGMFLFGTYRNKAGYDHNDDGYTDITQLKNGSFGFQGYHRLSDQTKLSAEFNNTQEKRRGGNKLEMLPHEADITEMVDHDILGGNVSLDFMSKDNRKKLSVYSSMQNVNRDSYYGANQDLSAYGHTTDLTLSNGIQFVNNSDNVIFAPGVFTAGVESNSDFLEDTKKGSGGLPNTIISDQRMFTTGLFAQNEWDMGFMKLLLGLRYDHYDVLDNINEAQDVHGDVVVPRANVMVDLGEHVQWRLAYSRGYRAPQIFDEDLHIETSGARKVIHKNVDGLKQETSNSFTSAFDYTCSDGKVQKYFLVEGFYTRLADPFLNEMQSADVDGVVTSLRKNAIYDATVTGVNIEAKVAPSARIMAQMGGTFQLSRYDQEVAWGDDERSSSDQILRTPERYGYLTINYEPVKKLSLSVTGNYSGPMMVPHLGLSGDSEEELSAIAAGDVIAGEKLEVSPDMFDLGCKVSYKIKVGKQLGIQLYAGVKNMLNTFQDDLDRGVFRDAGYMYGPLNPQTFYFGLKMGNLL